MFGRWKLIGVNVCSIVPRSEGSVGGLPSQGVFHVRAGAGTGRIAAIESLDRMRQLQAGSRHRVKGFEFISEGVVRIVRVEVVCAVVRLNRVKWRDGRVHIHLKSALKPEQRLRSRLNIQKACLNRFRHLIM